MHGIVIWKHPQVESAIIWCEDGQSLAFVQDLSTVAQGGAHPDSGDLVAFQCTEGEVRHCIDVRLVRRGVWPGIAQELLGESSRPAAGRAFPALGTEPAAGPPATDPIASVIRLARAAGLKSVNLGAT